MTPFPRLLSSTSAGQRRVCGRNIPGKKVDGKTVDRTRISRDTYRAQQRIIASYGGGTSSEPQTREPEKSIVEDGISE